MASIGQVTANSNGGFKGQIRTLSIRAEIEIVPNEQKAHDNQPDYRVMSNGIEVGAGWNRRSETTGRDYVSLSLAAPEFGQRRLYANLGRAAFEGWQHEILVAFDGEPAWRLFDSYYQRDWKDSVPVEPEALVTAGAGRLDALLTGAHARFSAAQAVR